jgi:hypothetical protein
MPIRGLFCSTHSIPLEIIPHQIRVLIRNFTRLNCTLGFGAIFCPTL